MNSYMYRRETKWLDSFLKFRLKLVSQFYIVAYTRMLALLEGGKETNLLENIIINTKNNINLWNYKKNWVFCK